MLKKIEFWLDCLGKGLLPWKIQASTVEELEELRVRGAQELEQKLREILVARHGANVGIHSAIAKANMRAGHVTRINHPLGKRRGTTYTLVYVRAGRTEFWEVVTDGVKIWLVPWVQKLSLRQQQDIWRIL